MTAILNNASHVEALSTEITDNCTRINYFAVVNISEDNEITVLDSLFEYNDRFKGATGSKFEPITLERYEEVINMDEEEIADYLIDNGFELPDNYKRGGFIEWAEQFTDNDKLSLFFNLSYSEKWDELRKQCGLSIEDARIFNCVGGGRCFEKDFKGNKNKSLHKLIRQYEA